MERILVVDNDSSSRATLVALVQGPETVVEEAGNGDEVLERLRAGIAYDLILSAIQMAGIDGIELSRQIGQLDPTIVTVLITGSREPSQVIEAMRAGASDFLWKPYTLAEVDDALVRARKRREQLGWKGRHCERLEERAREHNVELIETRRLLVRHQQLQRRQVVSSIKAHARAIGAKDPYTAGHCDRVERYTALLARRARVFNTDTLFNLRVAALLHDIGKIGVPGALLCKPGILEPAEQRQVESHPVIGARIVRTLEDFNLEPAVRHHHERFDGKGYPDKLKGEAIPLEARLILAADTFDAMTSNRPYRRALDTGRAMEELQKFSGKQFDPEVVKLMNAAASELETARRKSTEKPHELEGLAEAS